MSNNSEEAKPVAAPPRRLRRWLKRGCVVCLVFAFIACGVFWWYTRGPGSQYGQLLRYQERYRVKAEQWNRVIDSLPPVGSVDHDECLPLDPKPRYSFEPPDGNCEITQEPHAFYRTYADPQTAPSFYMDVGNGLEKSLIWYTTPHIELHEWNGSRSRALPGVEDELKRGLAQIYLVVVRPCRYEPVRETETGFTGGRLKLEGFVIDLRTEKRVGQFAFAVEPPKRLELQKSLDPNVSNAEYSNRRAAEAAVVPRLMEKLRELTGGEFTHKR